jgi:hypothetical protein
MGALTFLTAWVGYWMLTYGVATVRGCNVTLTEIGWPGKFQGCTPDGGSGGSSGGVSPVISQRRKTLGAGTSAGPGIINPIANL